jgi:hypothetical protein
MQFIGSLTQAIFICRLRCQGPAHPRTHERGSEALQVCRWFCGIVCRKGKGQCRVFAIAHCTLTLARTLLFQVANRGLCAVAQAESLRYKLLGGLAVRRACYGVLRFVMESGAKGCEVIVSGKLRAQVGARASALTLQYVALTPIESNHCLLNVYICLPAACKEYEVQGWIHGF